MNTKYQHAKNSENCTECNSDQKTLESDPSQVIRGDSSQDILSKDDLSYKNHPKVRLRESWINFLSIYEWDWFGTLTFEKDVHPEKGSKLYKKLINDLNRSLYGRRWMNMPHEGVFWVRSSEFQKRGSLHYHFLMGSEVNLNTRSRRLYWMDYWKKIAGFARIEDVGKREAALSYVTKYVVKDGEIDLSANLKHYFRQLDLSGLKG